MQDFIDFGLRHWELFLAFMLILVYWLISEYLENRGGHGVTALQLIHLMNREHGIVIDLRDADHFEAGHIMNALSFPEKDFMAHLNKLKKYQSKPVILVDKTGAVSSRFLNQLSAKGYTHTRYLKNGMHAWSQAGMPLEKSEKLEKGKKSNGKN
jgi:rhodanese-related sulfurtransferase